MSIIHCYRLCCINFIGNIAQREKIIKFSSTPFTVGEKQDIHCQFGTSLILKSLSHASNPLSSNTKQEISLTHNFNSVTSHFHLLSAFDGIGVATKPTACWGLRHLSLFQVQFQLHYHPFLVKVVLKRILSCTQACSKCDCKQATITCTTLHLNIHMVHDEVRS